MVTFSLQSFVKPRQSFAGWIAQSLLSTLLCEGCLGLLRAPALLGVPRRVLSCSQLCCNMAELFPSKRSNINLLDAGSLMRHGGDERSMVRQL